MLIWFDSIMMRSGGHQCQYKPLADRFCNDFKTDMHLNFISGWFYCKFSQALVQRYLLWKSFSFFTLVYCQLEFKILVPSWSWENERDHHQRKFDLSATCFYSRLSPICMQSHVKVLWPLLTKILTSPLKQKRLLSKIRLFVPFSNHASTVVGVEQIRTNEHHVKQRCLAGRRGAVSPLP